MQARRSPSSARIGRSILAVCALAVLTPAVVLAASVSPTRHAAAPAFVPVNWDGHATIEAHSVDRGSAPLTYRAEYSWHVTFMYDPVGKGFRPATTPGTIKGTASRIVEGGGSTQCSGPVTGSVGAPAVSVDRAGNAVIDADEIPGFGETLLACYGPVAPPIFPQMSRAVFAFHAKTKLSRLLGGTASASDHGGGSNTSTFQGSVCTKGCVAATPASTGGFHPIAPSNPTPNPNDPIYTYEATVSWNASVSVAGAGCSSPADTKLLAKVKANISSISSKAIIDDSNAQIQKIIYYGRTVLKQYPDDRPMRKTLMNKELSDVQAEMRRIYDEARRHLTNDAARDVALAKCPDTKQLVQGMYDSEVPKLNEQEDTDLRFAASRAVKVIDKNCGCVG